MNVQQLKKQLQYELKQNPKRAAVLGLLLVVGCWFWAPLVIGMFTGKPKPAPPTATAEPTAAAPTAAIATAEASELDPKQWREWARWLDEHRGRPAELDMAALGRSPFAPPKIEQPPEEKEEEPLVVEVTPPKQDEIIITPEQRGLSVSSTLVSDKRRLAVLGGRVFAEGSTLDTGGEIVFTLRRVQPGKVVLSRNGRNFELKAPVATAANSP